MNPILPSGKPSRGPIHPDYVPSIFSYTANSVSPSSRYLRAVKRSKTAAVPVQSAHARQTSCQESSQCQVKETDGLGKSTGDGEDMEECLDDATGKELEDNEYIDYNDSEDEGLKEHDESGDTDEEGYIDDLERTGDDETDQSSDEGLIHQLELKEVEIGELQIDNKILVQDNERLGEENLLLKSQLSELMCVHNITSSALKSQKSNEFSARVLKGDDKKVCFYTGLPSYDVFKGLYQLLEPLLLKDESKSYISLIDELLLVLVKLRLGVPNHDLGYRFNISSSTVGTIFHKWIDVMSVELKCLIHWPDSITLRENMPSGFRKHFLRVRCIIDCFEIFIERPSALLARAATYSNYKRHNTVKVFIAVTPTGSISFISQAWGGRVSDKEITQRCGFLNKIERGDQVMADRGFNIADDLAVCGAHLVIPSFTRGKSQLSQMEVEQSRRLARVRIHVERIIGQMRKKYTILHNTLPISLIKCPSDSSKTNCTIDRILIVTAALTNLSPSVIPP